MRHKTTKALYAYWNALRGSRMAPRRFEIEPCSIGEMLPDTFILERNDATSYPYRLAGTRLCERFKKEFRSHDFLAGWTPADAARLRDRLNSVSLQGGVALLRIEAETATGKPVLLETIVLPLIHLHAHADRFLGAFSALETPGWLGYEPIARMQIVTDDIIWPDGRPWSAVENPDRQGPFLPHVRKSRIVRSERRQFRVFDGGLAGTDPEPPGGPAIRR